MSDHQHSAASGGEHTEAADAVEGEIDGLQRESERLDAQIGETRADWESRKADDKVPGADGPRAEAEGGGESPEAEHSAAVDAPVQRDASSGEHEQQEE